MSEEIAPELVARMVAHCRGVVDRFKDVKPGKNPELDDVRAIVAELPEPRDDDIEEAKCMALNAERDFVTPHAPARLARLEAHLLTAIKRGRELERSA